MRLIVSALFFLCTITFSAQASDCSFYLNRLSLFSDENIKFQKLEVETVGALNEKLQNELASQARIANDVRNELRKKIAARSSMVRTVIYPASGFDGATAFLTFPAATLVVGIDNHPFIDGLMKRIEPRVHPFDDSATQGYTVFSQVDEVDSISEFLLGRMKASIPGFRLRNVFAISHFNYSHGIIEFDSGPGTSLKRFVHIQTDPPQVGSPLRLSEPWWMKAILNHGFEAVLVKGSMEFFWDYNESEGKPLVEYLRSHEGILVDGDLNGNWPWNPKGYEATLHQRTEIFPFGYSTALIISFDENGQPRPE